MLQKKQGLKQGRCHAIHFHATVVSAGRVGRVQGRSTELVMWSSPPVRQGRKSFKKSCHPLFSGCVRLSVGGTRGCIHGKDLACGNLLLGEDWTPQKDGIVGKLQEEFLSFFL